MDRNQKLEHLISILEKLPEESLEMGTWCGGISGHPCDTVACAGGWACMDSAFQSMGLKFVEGAYNDRLPGYSHSVTYPDGALGTDMLIGYAALSKFFEIGGTATHYIFDPNYYTERDIKIEDVVGRIRNVIKEGIDNGQ